MLRYKLRVSKDQNIVKEIECEYLYFALDKSFIYGITSPNYGLVNGQNIYLKKNGSNSFKKYKSIVSNKTYRGFVVFENQPYKVIDFKDFDGFKDIVNKGIVFADGKKYISSDNKTLTVDSPLVVGNNVFNLDTDKILISTKYFVIDGSVVIDNIQYNVDFSSDSPSISLNNGLILNVLEYNKEDGLPNTITKTHFIINKGEDDDLNIQNITPVKKYLIVIINSKEYVLDIVYNSVSINDEQILLNNPIYTLTPTDGIGDILFGGDNSFPTDKISKSFVYDPKINNTYITYHGLKISINELWRNSEYGDNINIYLSKISPICNVGDTILVSLIENKPQMHEIDDTTNTVVVNNTIYRVSDGTLDYLVYWSADEKNPKYEEYLITYTNDEKTKGYVVIGDIISRLTINGNVATKLFDNLRQESASNSKNTFEVNKYHYVDINDEKYLVYDEITNVTESEIITQRVIYTPSKLPIKLIVNYANSTQIRCNIDTKITNVDSEIYNICENKDKYQFKLEDSLFDDSVIANVPSQNYDYIASKYQVFYDAQNINLPILISNKCATNLHQEYVCDQSFFNSVYSSVITPTVDMEKDVYYPAYYDYESNKATLIDTIRFDLHFRSRNQSDWKIISDDYMGEYQTSRCNWNIIDAYTNAGNEEPINALKPNIDFNEFKYYQPSDLLYFLNFSDSDVFYQKKKIEKSFLRILFFDSPNPDVQSLLSSSTVFLNEGTLYMKYVNNLNSDTEYINVNEIDSSLNRSQSNNIGVNYDTFDTLSNKVTCIEDKRLSSTIMVKNMFETLESSEGFYMYLFKDYSNGLHQRTIYMKVEFNHAGVGKTLNFMQPFKYVNGMRSMLDFSKKEDIDLLKNGIPLDEFIDHLYIPINVQYDFKLKKYIYYLPDWLTVHNQEKEACMRFNLYETKIKDESNIIHQKPMK